MRLVVCFLIFFFILFLWSGQSAAQTDLFALFPDNEIPGWSRVEEPKQYTGEELFLMIDGGADIYFEYGFAQVLAGDFENSEGDLIRLELYEMKSPQLAYGIYSYKIGQEGIPVSLGQAALLEEYYLNLWKGNLLVTIAGSDAQAAILDAVTAFGRFVDERYLVQGDVPELVSLLRAEPQPLTRTKYILGSIGAMSDYVFDTADIFKVEEGATGFVGDNQVFVFRYADPAKSAAIFASAAASFATNSRFPEVTVQDKSCFMVGRDQESVVMREEGRNIIIVIGGGKETAVLVEQLITKVKEY